MDGCFACVPEWLVVVLKFLAEPAKWVIGALVGFFLIKKPFEKFKFNLDLHREKARVSAEKIHNNNIKTLRDIGLMMKKVDEAVKVYEAGDDVSKIELAETAFFNQFGALLDRMLYFSPSVHSLITKIWELGGDLFEVLKVKDKKEEEKVSKLSLEMEVVRIKLINTLRKELNIGLLNEDPETIKKTIEFLDAIQSKSGQKEVT